MSGHGTSLSGSRVAEIRARAEEHLAITEAGGVTDHSLMAVLARDVLALCDLLAETQRWFTSRPWEGSPDPSAHGGHPYSEYERVHLGYGTYRDERFLPRALASAARETEPGGGGER